MATRSVDRHTGDVQLQIKILSLLHDNQLGKRVGEIGREFSMMLSQREHELAILEEHGLITRDSSGRCVITGSGEAWLNKMVLHAPPKDLYIREI